MKILNPGASASSLPFSCKHVVATAAVAIGILFSSASALAAQSTPLLPVPAPSISTVPSNGDVNPYGVLFVPEYAPRNAAYQSGDILVSNFNNSNNLQGTGTTITRIDRNGQTSTFFQGPAPLGLTAALGMLRDGTVLVGNLPTLDGTAATVMSGSLLFLDRQGHQIGSLADSKIINGPWGLAIAETDDDASVFVSNVLGGTVVRLDLERSASGYRLQRAVTIASNYNHRVDPAALVLGPSGLLYDRDEDTLFVAESSDNAIYAVPNARRANASNGVGTLVTQDLTHLHGPLDLIFAPNGDLLVANSDGSNADPNQPSTIVELTKAGAFVAQFSVDPNNGGAFGLAIRRTGDVAILASVDDNTNSLKTWTKMVK